MSLNEDGTLRRYISLDGTFRVVVCLNTAAVAEAITRHRLVGLAAVALGRTMTAAQLLATLTKGEERVTLQVVGDGPIRGVVADAWSNGGVRGYVYEPAVLPLGEGPKRQWVSKAIGRSGVVTVFRDLGLKDIYQGHGTLVQGEIDEDVEGYLRTSEQIPTALGCETILRGDGEVLVSGGIMVQAMPGTKEREGDPVREAQHRLRTGYLRKALEAGDRDLAALAAGLVEGHLLKALADVPLEFTCPCSRQRVLDALATLGPKELESMIREDGRVETTCRFCGERYVIPGQELERILQDLKRRLN